MEILKIAKLEVLAKKTAFPVLELRVDFSRNDPAKPVIVLVIDNHALTSFSFFAGANHCDAGISLDLLDKGGKPRGVKNDVVVKDCDEFPSCELQPLIDARSITEISLVSHIHVGFLLQCVGAERGPIVDDYELMVARESLNTFDATLS